VLVNVPQEVRLRSDFDQHGALEITHERGDAVGEAHGTTRVAHPVLRPRRRCHRAAVDVAYDSNATRRARANLARSGVQRRQRLVHLRRVEAVRNVQLLCPVLRGERSTRKREKKVGLRVAR
jgi:hypothetical protein